MGVNTRMASGALARQCGMKSSAEKRHSSVSSASMAGAGPTTPTGPPAA